MTQGHLGVVFYCDFPYTDPILKGGLRLALPGRVVYYDIRTSGAVFYSDFPYTDPIPKGSIRLTLAGRESHVINESSPIYIGFGCFQNETNDIKISLMR